MIFVADSSKLSDSTINPSPFARACRTWKNKSNCTRKSFNTQSCRRRFVDSLEFIDVFLFSLSTIKFNWGGATVPKWNTNPDHSHY